MAKVSRQTRRPTRQRDQTGRHVRLEGAASRCADQKRVPVQLEPHGEEALAKSEGGHAREEVQVVRIGVQFRQDEWIRTGSYYWYP